METLSFEFPAGQPPTGRALVGCVGSGDLEVLLEPGTPGRLTIQVQTSVNGAEQRWQHQLHDAVNTFVLKINLRWN